MDPFENSHQKGSTTDLLDQCMRTRGLDFVSIGRHADREAPATTERVLRTRGWEKDLAQGAVPLAGFLI